MPNYYDPFYQEWHFERTQSTENTDQEWWIDVPRPLGSPGAGKYWAIEIHSIELQSNQVIPVPDAAVFTQVMRVCVTSAPRTDKTPFVTTCANPDNIFYYEEQTFVPTAALTGGFLTREESRGRVLQRYTDDQFHGKLYIGDHLYIQLNTVSQAAVVKICFCIEFTWTTINCSQLVEELQGQLNES